MALGNTIVITFAGVTVYFATSSDWVALTALAILGIFAVAAVVALTYVFGTLQRERERKQN